MHRRYNYTVRFLVLLKKLVPYFASIKEGVTIIINYENILQLMTTVFLSKLRTFLTQLSA